MALEMLWTLSPSPSLLPPSLVFAPPVLYLQSTSSRAEEIPGVDALPRLSVSNCWSLGVIKSAGLSETWKRRLERVMERTDQEGHQLPKTGQTTSRMPLLYLLTLMALGAGGGGAYRKEREEKNHGFQIMAQGSWPLRSERIDRKICKRDNPLDILSLSLPLHMVILRTSLSARPEFTMLIDLFPYNPWASVPMQSPFAFVWGCTF